MVPALMAGAVGANILGSAIGAAGNNSAINKGKAAYTGLANQGIQTLQQGQQAANAAFSPYTQAGQAGVEGQLNAVQNRVQAQGPVATGASPQSAMDYINPSAAYTSGQANAASTAAALASGSTGGGMLKALSNNANKMAMTNYNDAYQQMLNTNNQNFGQQQQQYENQTAYDQSQIGNYAGLAGQGLSAVGANQNLNQGYNNQINANYLGQADNAGSAWNKKGQIFNNTAAGIGNDIGTGMMSIWGAPNTTKV